MKNKYEDRAIAIINCTEFFEGTGNIFPNTSTVIDIMCQMAEEVERKVISDKILKPISKHRLFVREQVEELFQKQRELIAELAKTYEDDYDIDLDFILNAKLKID